MNKVCIIYDCPFGQNDKLWVYRKLKENNIQVSFIDSPVRISQVEQRGRLGKLKARMITLEQCRKAMKQTEADDIIFCWTQWAGLFMNLISRRRRKIISYNWLTPEAGMWTRWIYTKALRNKQLAVVINCQENGTELLRAYRVQDQGNIFYIPDVYDDGERFQHPCFIRNKNKRYCFMGGRANRDWELFMHTAALCPEIQFLGAAVKSDWKDTLEIPCNVEMVYDITPEEYYVKLENAFLAIFPLKENKVSGLINIVKAVQLGKIVLVTNLPATRMYYPGECIDLLIQKGNVAEMAEAVQKVFHYTEQEYCEKVLQMRQHIENGFSPKMAIDKIQLIIKYLVSEGECK